MRQKPTIQAASSRAPLRPGRAALAALVAGVVLVPRAAPASAGEQEAWLALGARLEPSGSLAAAGELRWLHNLDDYWALGLTLQDRRKALGGGGDEALLGTARLVVDALTWIPALAVSLGPAWSPGGGWDALVRLEGSLGWRPARTWGLAVVLAAEQPARLTEAPRWLGCLGAVFYFGGVPDLDL
jgi:hypothetical protein